MQNEKYIEGIPYTAQILRWFGAALGALLIGIVVVSLYGVETPQPGSLGYRVLLVSYGGLLLLPWRRLARRPTWFLLFGLFVTLSVAAVFEIILTCAGLARRADSVGAWIGVIAGAFLALFVAGQVACVWFLQRRVQGARRSTRAKSARPVSGREVRASRSRVPFAIIPPALATQRDQWIATLLLAAVLALYIFGLSASVSIPPGRGEVSLARVVTSLSTLDMEQLRTDFLVRTFVWFVPASVLLWCAFIGGMHVRAVAWGCAIASLGLPLFFLSSGWEAVLQWLYLPVLAFTVTIGALSGTLSGTTYQEGNLCMAAFGWWMLLWVGLVARMVLRWRRTTLSTLLSEDAAVESKPSDLPNPS